MRSICWMLIVCAAAGARAQNVSEQYLLAAANQDRAARGAAPLRTEPALARAARQHALLMMQHRNISHQFSGEADVAERAGTAGVRFSLVTENVAEAQNAAQIHDLWMHSSGHRANLLDPQVNAVGIAVVQDRGQLYAVEDFAKMVESLSLEGQEARVANLLRRAGMAVLPAIEDARRTCSLATGFAGDRHPGLVMRFTSSDLGQLPAGLASRLAAGKYREAEVGACAAPQQGAFTSYSLAVLLFP